VSALPVSINSEAEADDVNQPGDVAFVTTSLLQASASTSATCPLVHGLLAAGKTVLAGQSDGATTVDALAYDARYERATPTYRGVISLSGEEFGAGAAHTDPYAATSSSPPLLVVQSATDTCNPPQYSTQLYDAVTETDKWFLEIDDADHLPPYIGTDTAAFNVVVKVTDAFLADEFAGRSTAPGLVALGNVKNVTSMSTGPRAPALAPLIQSYLSCYVTTP
jgi:hypothetical protein